MDKKIDIYETMRLLNEGGFGSVYLSMNVITNEIVALKLLNPELLLRAGFRERFREEALILRQMPRHEHIVQLLDYGEAQQQPYLVMEYLPGRDLRDLIDQGPLPVQQALEIAGQVADALAAAASQGLVHCDVKPENIRILEDPHTEALRVRLMDFGIARVLGADLRDIAGTVTYMAPELWRGESPAPAADIYALGCVLYEMLTARPPVYLLTESDPHTTRQALMRLHLYGLPDWSPFHNQKAMAALLQLLKELLDKEPSKRPPAEAVAKLLLDWPGSFPDDYCLQPEWSSELSRDPERTRTRSLGIMPGGQTAASTQDSQSTAQAAPELVHADLIGSSIQAPGSFARVERTPSGLQAHLLRTQASCDLGTAVCRAGLLDDQAFYTGTLDGEIIRVDLESARRVRWKIPQLKVHSQVWSFAAHPDSILFHTGGSDWYQVEAASGKLLQTGVFPEAGMRLLVQEDTLWMIGSRPIIYKGSFSHPGAVDAIPLEARPMDLPSFWQRRLLVPTRKGIRFIHPLTKNIQSVGPAVPARSAFAFTLPANRRSYLVGMYSVLDQEHIQHNLVRLFDLSDDAYPQVAEIDVPGQPSGGLQRSGMYLVLTGHDGQMGGWRVQVDGSGVPCISPAWEHDPGSGVQVCGDALVKNGLCLVPLSDEKGEKLSVYNAATGSLLNMQALAGETFLAPFMVDQMAAVLMGSGRLDVFRILINP